MDYFLKDDKDLIKYLSHEVLHTTFGIAETIGLEYLGEVRRSFYLSLIIY